ncbi:hypothetical protein RRF57_009964 [Xylaria bambusicola]|uniref:Uncharacterized protein n=1 Tax=Xylaria bambusicola TaxID=326684 RepID=A0AAN7Z2B1_9PEZI
MTDSMPRPQRYSVRRPNTCMRHQLMMVPTQASPRPPTEIWKLMVVGSPACTRKYVGVPPMAEPQKGCAANTIQAISVRRRSTPLKQSRYDVPASMASSRLFVWIIMATV